MTYGSLKDKLNKNKAIYPRPFLKWVGGKRQLLPEYEKRLPEHLLEQRVIKRYIEPFVGGGALFFFLKRNYILKNVYLFDINPELVMAYNVVKNYHKELLEKLEVLESSYLKKNSSKRKTFYYNIRDLYNEQRTHIDFEQMNREWVDRTSLFIFLNKTGYNGLYRLNKSGEFNVPHGRYKKPRICDKRTINAVSNALENTHIVQGDFTLSEDYVKEGALVYLDPPYRPLNQTSKFTNYSHDGFHEPDQIRLANFFKKMHNKGAYLILSNSDPKNEFTYDNFFDKLYGDFEVERINAIRRINQDISQRGEIKELIIRNYNDFQDRMTFKSIHGLINDF